MTQETIYSGRRGQLYLVVIPASVMLAFNMFSVTFSAANLAKAWDRPLDVLTLLKLVKFLGKMVAFQSIEHLFGVLFFFSSNAAIKLAFEILVSFEGVGIALCYFSGQIQS